MTTRPKSTASGYRWFVLGIAWAAFLVSFIDRLAWGNVALGVSHDLGLPLAALGVFVTAFYAGYVVSNAAAGLAIDWLGPQTMLPLSLLPLGAATFLFGEIGSAGAGLLLQVLMGLAAGADYAAGVKLIVTWFAPGGRGRAMGLYMTATSLAVVLTNFAVPRLLPRLGWPGVYHALGLLTAAVGVASWLVLRAGAAPAPAPVMARVRPEYRLLLRNRDLLILALAGFGALWGTWGFAFWANALMVRGAGLSALQAGGVMATAGLSALIAKPAAGLLSDALGGAHKRLTIVCLVGFALSLAAFGGLHGATTLARMAPLLGVFAFAYSPLMNTMVAEAAGPALAGSAAGVTNAVWALGNVIVPSVVGLAYLATHSFAVAFLILAAGPALGAVCTAFVQADQPRRSTGR